MKEKLEASNVKLLSSDHLMGLMGLKEPVADKTVSTSVIVGAPDKGRKDTGFPDFPFWIERDKGEIEIAIEVIDFTPAGHEGNGEWLGAYVQLGDAFTLDGQPIELTGPEEDRAEREFLEKANG